MRTVLAVGPLHIMDFESFATPGWRSSAGFGMRRIIEYRGSQINFFRTMCSKDPDRLEYLSPCQDGMGFVAIDVQRRYFQACFVARFLR